MSLSFANPLKRITIISLFVASATVVSAQIPAGSSARSIPTEVEKSDAQVSEVISRAEDHFRKGKLNLEDNNANKPEMSLIKPSIRSWSPV